MEEYIQQDSSVDQVGHKVILATNQEPGAHIRTYAPAYSWNLEKYTFFISWKHFCH